MTLVVGLAGDILEVVRICAGKVQWLLVASPRRGHTLIFVCGMKEVTH